MLSNVDKLLLTPAQQAEVKRQKENYNAAAAAGDTAGMQAAHQRAEEVRAAAGYSGGIAGDQYQLLSAAGNPAGYNGYESLINDRLNAGINAIAAGYENRMADLDLQRGQLVAEGRANQAGARSAVWNQQRLAADGLLTKGLSDTGIANAIIATALNQASSNAYQAMLDTQNDLAENEAARSAAKGEAMADAAELQAEAGELLGDAYLKLYQQDADRDHAFLMQQNKQEFDREKMGLDYYYWLAERQWLQENQ